MPDVEPAIDDLALALLRAFPSMRKTTVDLLMASGRDRSFAAGEQVGLGSGGPVGVFLVRTGIVAPIVRGADDREVAYRLLVSGDIGGLGALAEPGLGVVHMTWSHVELVTWPADLVRGLIRSDPGVGLDAIGWTLRMAADLAEMVDGLHSIPSIKRLARVCLRYPHLVFDPSRPALTRGNLASLMGTSREMMDRCMRQLEEDRILSRTPSGGLTLLDGGALGALAA